MSKHSIEDLEHWLGWNLLCAIEIAYTLYLYALKSCYRTSVDFLTDTTASTRCILTYLKLVAYIKETKAHRTRPKSIPTLYLSLFQTRANPYTSVNPKETRNVTITYIALATSIITHIIVLDTSLILLHTLIQNPNPLFSTYLACPIITIVFYCPLQISFRISQLVAYFAMSNDADAKEWKDLFHKPYFSTGIMDFWGRYSSVA